MIGTAALAPCTDPNAMELVKLTVAESARGEGLGRRLANTCIAHVDVYMELELDA